jgi:hypothetical protein
MWASRPLSSGETWVISSQNCSGVDPSVFHRQYLVVLQLLLHDGGQVRIVAFGAVVVNPRPQGDHLVVDLGVVSLHNEDVGEVLAWGEIPIPFLPVLHLPQGLAQLVRSVHPQGLEYDVLYRLREVFPGQFGELPGNELESLPVVLGLPGRLGGRLEGVHEGVHVAEGEVVFLIPEGGREDHIGVVGGGVHANVQVHQQIQLAGGSLFGVELDFLHQPFGRLVVVQDVVMGAQEVVQS